MISDDEWTDDEFARFTERLIAFKENPESLSPEVYAKCKALHEEIRVDSDLVSRILKEGGKIGTRGGQNSKRAELANWLAKTP